MLILGGPWFGAKRKSAIEILLPFSHLLVYLVLGVTIFYIGYYVFLQGPLAIIEYVMFPVMAHFLHLGESIAKRSKNLWEALNTKEPWNHWALLDTKEQNNQ